MNFRPNVEIDIGITSKSKITQVHRLIGNTKIKPKYINIYHEELQFGGREEGGWWYEVGMPLRSICIMPLAKESLKNFNKRVEKKYEEVCQELKAANQYLPNQSSVLSTGVYVSQLDDKIGEFYPKSRPHYE